VQDVLKKILSLCHIVVHLAHTVCAGIDRLSRDSLPNHSKRLIDNKIQTEYNNKDLIF